MFPAANADWDDATIRAKGIKTKTITAEDGTRLVRLRVKTILANDSSVWLGDKLHVSDRAGRAQLQVRKETIPVYLAGIGVQLSHVQALGHTIANCTLESWIQLSENAGGSDDLSTIFPVANQSSDFELRTVVNELLIKPQDVNAQAGITINQAANAHPCLFFEGNASGHGLIQFGDQSAAKSLIYSSAADGHLHLEQFTGGKVQIDAVALDLATGCALTRNGVSIEGGGASAEDGLC